MSDDKGLVLKARPVRCGEEEQDIWRVRGQFDFGDGQGPREVVAEFDLKPEDNPPEREKKPQVRLDGGDWTNVEDAFVKDFRDLTKVSAPAGEGEKLCPSLFKPSLTITPKVEVTGNVTAKGGSSHGAYTGSFNNVDGVKPNAALVVQANPIEQLTATVEAGFGYAYQQTQPIGLSNDAYVDVPQAYLQLTFGSFCLGGGRRWARAGMPIEMNQPSVGGYSVRWYTQTIFGEVGYCTDKTFLSFAAGVGGDKAWKDDNDVPNGLLDFSHDFGPAGVWAHFEIDPQGEAKDMGLNWDASLRLGEGSVMGLFHGAGGVLEGAEAWLHWAAVYGQLMVEPKQSYVGGKARLGYNVLPPYLTGFDQNVRVVQLSGGLSVYPFQDSSILELGGLVDYQTPVDGEAIHDGGSHLVRFQLQAKTAYPFKIELK